MTDHLAASPAIGAQRTARFKSILYRSEERRGDRPIDLLSLSSAGHLYPRTKESDRQQASEQNVARCLVVNPGDLVVNPMWLTGGSIAVSDRTGAVSPDYRVFRPSPLVWPRFVHHVMRMPAYMDQYRLYTRADTTFDRRVQQADLDELPLPLPSLDQQRRIADFLDDQVSRIDNIISAREAQIALVRESVSHVLVDVAHDQGSLRKSPLAWFPAWRSDWNVQRLSWLVRCLDGRRIPLNATERSPRPGEYPYYGASSIVDYVDDYLFDGEFVLVGEDGAALENPRFDVVQRVSGKIWVNNHAHVLEATDINVDYLANFIRCVDRPLLISGATRPKITQEDLLATPIVVPPADIQEKLVAGCAERIAQNQTSVEHLHRYVTKITELKRSLITAAVTGEIDVSTADGSQVAT